MVYSSSSSSPSPLPALSAFLAYKAVSKGARKNMGKRTS